MTGRIVLFGATGFTGGRTAEAMLARGLRPVLAGRNPEALGARLGCETARADVTDMASVAALVGPSDVLVSTVGPFAELGGAALAAVVAAGATYLDSTGEGPFLREVFELQGPAAQRSGARLIPAFGYDFVPGVLAGALALREAGERAARVDVGYFLTGGGRWFSRGTAESAVTVASSPAFAVADGALVTEPGGRRLRTYLVDGVPRPAFSIGALEHFALPRLAPGLRTVDVHLGWFGRASTAVHRLPPPPGIALRGLRRLTTRIPREPDPAAAAAARSETVAEVFDAGGTLLARTRLRFGDPYSLTAALLAWGAAHASEIEGVGALDPVSAFGVDALVDSACADAGITIE
ncbi:NAD(P)H-binding protein [Pseudonocardia oroxyli]|uniref:NAD(P)H-binding protein n=1 Tax=Pseudonocardia oroxyli TaxID=366584 RepID=UPI001C40BA78|nr:NAD(P)H-binding protein [Pseudonocardia oroxyli]